ncbi:MAG: hypothetical protein FJ264_04380 [Planctomycetes bacterium]|nr:hypothetical protein [Planctomycetota bacterium]
MKRTRKDSDMLEEYDFSKGIRGKYTKRYEEGTNVVVIDPDVAKFFPDHDSVNQALRSIAKIIKRQKRAPNKSLQRTADSRR